MKAKNALQLLVVGLVPDGKTIALPMVSEHPGGRYLRAAAARESPTRPDNYFPPSASRACALTFFPDLTFRALPLDGIEISKER